MKTLKDYLKKAQKEDWAIGQFNFSTLEHLRGILDAAKRLKSPVIIGTTSGEINFFGLDTIVALVNGSLEKYKTPAFLHFDHGRDLKLIKKAIELGYKTVHFDGSRLSLEDNIKYTSQVVKFARKKRVLVEGELGYIEGESLPHKEGAKIDREYLTKPEEVLRFVRETKVDSLAVSIGNIHGVYRVMPSLDFKLLKEIRKLTSAFLVLHGCSGFPGREIKKAVAKGIAKAIFSTELRVVWKKSLQDELRGKEFKPYDILPKVQKAIENKVEEKIKILGSANKI